MTQRTKQHNRRYGIERRSFLQYIAAVSAIPTIPLRADEPVNEQPRFNGNPFTLGVEYPTNEVQPMHVAWIKQDLAQRTRGTFVVTTSEADLGKHCPGFETIARKHDIRLQLVGDSHVVTHKTDEEDLV